MKKSFNLFLVSLVLMLSFSGCSDRGNFQGKTYKSYGIFDEHKLKNPNVQYEVAVLPLVASAAVFLFVSSGFGIVAFVITIGWYLNIPTNEIVDTTANKGLIK